MRFIDFYSLFSKICEFLGYDDNNADRGTSCAETKIFARQSDPKPTFLVCFILFLYFNALQFYEKTFAICFRLIETNLK